MKTSKIQIMNLSCKGCVNTITKNLLNIDGVETAEVDLATDVVTVFHADTVEKNSIVKKLFALGYPEVNETNNLITKFKSKKSCIIGRIS